MNLTTFVAISAWGFICFPYADLIFGKNTATTTASTAKISSFVFNLAILGVKENSTAPDTPNKTSSTAGMKWTLVKAVVYISQDMRVIKPHARALPVSFWCDQCASRFQTTGSQDSAKCLLPTRCQMYCFRNAMKLGRQVMIILQYKIIIKKMTMQLDLSIHFKIISLWVFCTVLYFVSLQGSNFSFS